MSSCRHLLLHERRPEKLLYMGMTCGRNLTAALLLPLSRNIAQSTCPCLTDTYRLHATLDTSGCKVSCWKTDSAPLLGLLAFYLAQYWTKRTRCKIWYKLKVWGIFTNLLHRQTHYCISLLSKCLLYPLKKLSLPGILLGITKKHCTFR